MDLYADALPPYAESLVPPRPPELLAMEDYAREHDFPIIGPACGHLCYQLARMTAATRIFELGSGYGYSTAFFARAVQENGGGVVHHVVWDADLSQRARRHLDRLGLGDVVQYQVGEAIDALRAHQGTLDIVFDDIEKQTYPASLAVIEEKLRPGGLLIVDNMLWRGRIFDPGDRTPQTEGIREMTRRLTQSAGWISSLVPLRDGMIVALRR
jgi:predicted O-methyltransferase YrrM